MRLKINLPEFDRLFPTACSMALCSWLHSSSSTDRTRETCAPKFRWIPEHSIQISMPRLSEAQVGFGIWQSAQDLLPGRSKFSCEPRDPIDRDSSDSVRDPQLRVFLIIFSMRSTHSSRWAIFSHEKTQWSPVTELTTVNSEFDSVLGCPLLPGTLIEQRPTSTDLQSLSSLKSKFRWKFNTFS